jgi:formylglycine-generating enzyme required for sulfatase activity
MTDAARDRQLDQLIATLGTQLGLTGEEIADILWLALKRQDSEESLAEVTPQQAPPPSVPQEPDVLPSTDTIASNQSEQPAPTATGLYPQTQSNQSQTSQTGTLPLRVPDAPSLRKPLILAQALRPLMRRIASGRRTILDEVATAQRIAAERLCIPVLKPELEPWFDLALVVDQNPSMLIWRHTIRELERVLKHYGAFRDVRTWGLVTDESGQIGIQPGTGSAQPQRVGSPRELIDPSSRRLVLVVSDCVAAIWRNGTALSALKDWAESQPAAIVQMLPDRLWSRTGLGLGASVQLGNLTPGGANQQLLIKELLLWKDIDLDNGIKLPVLTLEPEVAASWSQMVAARGDAVASGVVFPPELPGEVRQPPPTRSRPLDAKGRVYRFRMAASPMARKLAGLLAAAPAINLAIVRLIQETLLPQSNQTHVAEVFLGGLLKPLTPIEADTNPDAVQYEFMDDEIRDILLEAAPVSDSVEVIDAVSGYVAGQLGTSLEEFVALLKAPGRGDEDTVQPFAVVTARILKRLGGDYARFAEELESSGAKTTVQVECDRNFLWQQGNTKIYSLCTDSPWQLPFDGLVIPVGHRGDVGQLGYAFKVALGKTSTLFDESMKRTMIENGQTSINPDEPLFVALPPQIKSRLFSLDGESVEHFIVCVTLEFSKPDIDNITRAVTALIYGTAKRKLKRLVLPLLGAGSIGLPANTVARIMLPAIDQALKRLPLSSIEEITLVGRYEGTITIINQVAQHLFKQNNLNLHKFTVEPPRVGAKGLSPLQDVASGHKSRNKKDSESKEVQLLQKFEFEVVTVNRRGEIIQTTTKQARYFSEDLSNDITLDMVAIPRGTFLMGAPDSEKGHLEGESPQHQVTVQSFFMGKYPVTQAQWQAAASLPRVNHELNPEPSRFRGNNLPVEQVSWCNAVEFCARLSRLTGREYRLPSEAEWEYACRGETTTPFHFGETITTDLANYNGNYTYDKSPNGEYREQTTPVGYFKVANTFGLYDMHGNVYEWCKHPDRRSYENAPTDGSVWLSDDKNAAKIIRGGCWYSYPVHCRCAYRYYFYPGVSLIGIGFRVVCVAPQDSFVKRV